MCHGLKNVGNITSPALVHDIPTLTEGNSFQFRAEGRKLLWTQVEYSESEILGVIKLNSTNHQMALSTLDTDQSFGPPDSKKVFCSQFYDQSLSFCRADLLRLDFNATFSIRNLGSFSCQSSYGHFCDRLLGAYVSGSECSLLGCGIGKLLDIDANRCVDIRTMKPPSAADDSAIHWYTQPLADYYSRCRAVELGFIRPHQLNCFCDRFCVYFNDCCEDSRFQATESSRLGNVYSCHTQGFVNMTNDIKWGVMMIDTCPPISSEGAQINETVANLCEEVNRPWPPRDLQIDYVPVTDRKTSLV